MVLLILYNSKYWLASESTQGLVVCWNLQFCNKLYHDVNEKTNILTKVP